MMTFILLGLFALTSVGVTTTICRASFETEQETQTEECEESVAWTASRRARLRILVADTKRISDCILSCNPKQMAGIQRTIIGHRLANDLLAPIRI